MLNTILGIRVMKDRMDSVIYCQQLSYKSILSSNWRNFPCTEMDAGE